MEEKRRFNRWVSEGSKYTKVQYDGIEENAPIINIGAGGMKIQLSYPVHVGSEVKGNVSITPDGGPFYVDGKVIRVASNERGWQAVVKFDRVSTIPLR